MTDKLYPSYNEIHNACIAIENSIRTMNFKPDRIIGLSRGGLLPGIILSHIMDVPFTPISFSSKDGAGDNKNHDALWSLPPVDGNEFLIVDDICDTSFTLTDIVAYFRSKGKIVQTAVIHYKVRAQGTHIPDYYWMRIPEDSGWVVYPFERKEFL